jgi:uncharacterized protein
VLTGHVLAYDAVRHRTTMHPAFTRTDHRPWPHPQRPHHWRQSWLDLMFAHWRIDAEALRPLVPPELEIQEFDGSSWIGVVPFRMRGVMLRGLPSLPWVSNFPELNLRIYVEHEGRPGVWFFSLDASNSLAVWAARTFFHLPYQWASMGIEERAGTYHYRSRRHLGPERAEFAATYRPTSDVFEAEPGSLEHWLTERYQLFAQSPDGRLFKGQIHHHPWPLQRAETEIARNRLLAPHGLAVEGAPESVLFAKRIEVAVWNLERLTT